MICPRCNEDMETKCAGCGLERIMGWDRFHIDEYDIWVITSPPPRTLIYIDAKQPWPVKLNKALPLTITASGIEMYLLLT